MSWLVFNDMKTAKLAVEKINENFGCPISIDVGKDFPYIMNQWIDSNSDDNFIQKDKDVIVAILSPEDKNPESIKDVSNISQKIESNDLPVDWIKPEPVDPAVPEIGLQ